MNILIVGLDNSGKTSIIERMKLQSGKVPKGGMPQEVTPTVGFSVDVAKVRCRSPSLTCPARAGTGTSGSATSGRRPRWCSWWTARTSSVCASRRMSSTPCSNPPSSWESRFWCLRNKMDLPTALSPVDVAQGLSLDEIEAHPWQIVPSNALDGSGLQEGLDWLANFLNK